jgi:acyl-CoA thioesterase I
MFRKLLKILSIILISLSSLLAQSDNKVILLGDSLSDGFGLETPEHAWPYLLKETCNLQVTNLSNAGATLQEGLSRLKRYLNLNHDENNILLIALGSNDGLRGYPPKAIEQHLKDVIKEAKARQLIPIIIEWKLPPNYGSYAIDFKNIFKKVALDEKIGFIPFPLETFGSDLSYFQKDQYHPNDKAQKKIAAEVCDGMKDWVTHLVDL